MSYYVLIDYFMRGQAPTLAYAINYDINGRELAYQQWHFHHFCYAGADTFHLEYLHSTVSEL